MEAKHTKGEWSIIMPKNGKCYAKISGDSWLEFAKVVVMMSCGSDFDEVGLANAKLIAAAPDLLEALSTVLDKIKWVRTDYDGMLNETEWYQSAKQAIKKATE